LTGYGPVLTATALLLAVLGALHAATGSWERAWHDIGVPSYHNTFGDLRVITHSIPCADAGIDPYVKEACNDYWKANPRAEAPYQDLLLNYPPIWLQSGHLGASPASTNLLGVAIGLAAMLCFWRILRPRTAVGGLIAVAAILSPSILLGFERGNIDLVIFSMLVFVIVVTQRLPAASRAWVRGIGVVLMTVLKFFPVVCVTLLVRSRRSWITALATGIVAVAAAWFAADGRFASVLSNTPKVDNLAFGSLPLLIGLNKALGGAGVVSKGASVLAMLMSVAAFLAVFVPAWKRKLARPLPQYLPAIEDDLNGSLAVAGLSIFCVAFLFGASFDYRLIFLVLTLPLLIAAYEHENEREGARRLVAPVVIVVFFWLSRATDKIAHVDEVLDWVIFAVGSAWIASRLLLNGERQS
jgi:hypothetical protein